MSDAIRIVKATTHKPKPKDSDLGFGTLFTDHMFVADFHAEKGWYDPRVEPYGPIPLDPAAAVLHYAQAIFDGLKAFRGADGKVRLFRPQKHVQRMNHSAAQMCIPPLDPELALRSLVTLVGIERDWVPKTVGTSLYVRPTIIASEAFLGVRPAKSYIYFVILSPVGAYYPEGMAPVKIRVEEKHVRAVEGGLGDGLIEAPVRPAGALPVHRVAEPGGILGVSREVSRERGGVVGREHLEANRRTPARAEQRAQQPRLERVMVGIIVALAQ